MATDRMTVRIDARLRSRLRAMSRRQKRKESELVREALEALQIGVPEHEAGDRDQHHRRAEHQPFDQIGKPQQDEERKYQPRAPSQHPVLLEGRAGRAEEFGVADLDWTTLRQVQGALKRIEAGTFGKCVVNQRPISEKRLKDVPWGRYCLKHQQELELKASIKTPTL